MRALTQVHYKTDCCALEFAIQNETDVQLSLHKKKIDSETLYFLYFQVYASEQSKFIQQQFIQPKYLI